MLERGIFSKMNIVMGFISSLITILAIILPVCKFFVLRTEWTLLEIIYTLISLFLLIVVIFFFVWNRKSFRSYLYPLSKITSNYIIDKKIIKYKKNSKNCLSFSKKFIVRSCISNLESFTDKYIWTGNSSPAIPKARGRFVSTAQREDTIGIWTYYKVMFNRRVCKGQSEEVECIWPSIPNCDSSSAFVSTETDVPTKYIEFQLDLGEDFAGSDLILEEFRAIDSDYSLFDKFVKFDENGRYTWKIASPKRFRSYRMRWSWEKIDIPSLPKNSDE